MSAFIVSARHIDYLLTFALEHERSSPLSWFVAAEAPPEEPTHEAGQPWGPGAIAHMQDRRRQLTFENASTVGAILVAENRRSVDYRYNESEMEDFYTFTRQGSTDAVQTLKAVACYRYQACETPDWEQSEAFAICRAIEARAIRCLPGYEKAAWEIPAVAPKRRA